MTILSSFDGFGGYIWGSFALTLVIVVFNEWHARAHHRNIYRDIEVRIKAVEERL